MGSRDIDVGPIEVTQVFIDRLLPRDVSGDWPPEIIVAWHLTPRAQQILMAWRSVRKGRFLALTTDQEMIYIGEPNYPLDQYRESELFERDDEHGMSVTLAFMGSMTWNELVNFATNARREGHIQDPAEY